MSHEKMNAVLAVCRSFNFTAEEQRELISMLVDEFGFTLFDFYPQYLKQLNTFLNKSREGLSEQEENLKALSAMLTAPPKVTKTSSINIDEAPAAKQDGAAPVKRRGGRPKGSKNRSKENKSEASPNVSISKEAEAASEKQPSEPEADTNGDVVKPVTIITSTRDYRENEHLREDLGWKVLYQNPNNLKQIFISSKYYPDCNVWGILVPYLKKKACFAVSFTEEKKIMTLKEAKSKDRTKRFPKFHGMEWDILSLAQNESIMAVKMRLNSLIRKLKGAEISDKYLTDPLPYRSDACRVRYSIELPGIDFEPKR